MPVCFQCLFGKKVTVIIDCFEVFIEKPSNLLAGDQTFSNYKHHNTIKILIGITPQGSISFVSESWGGCTSGTFLTENCRFLDKLVPGDVVMADRGFTVAERVGMRQARLVIPAFTKGKSQLDPVDVEKTRGIANVRIHVERVIGLFRRKYIILEVLFQLIFLYPVRMPHQSLTTSSKFVQLLLIYVHQYYHMTRNFDTSAQLCQVVQRTQELSWIRANYHLCYVTFQCGFPVMCFDQ